MIVTPGRLVAVRRARNLRDLNSAIDWRKPKRAILSITPRSSSCEEKTVMRILCREATAKCTVLALAFSLTASVAAGQRNRSLKARIFIPDGSPSQSVKVRLEGSEGELIRDSFTDSTGTFEVSTLSTGIFKIVVPTDDRAYATTTERIEITR